MSKFDEIWNKNLTKLTGYQDPFSGKGNIQGKIEILG